LNENRVNKRAAFLINLLYFGAVVTIIILAVRYVLGWMMPFIIGFVIAMIFHPFIRLVSKKLRLHRSIVAVVVVVLGYAGIVTGIIFGSLRLFSWLSELFSLLPTLFETQILPAFNQVGDLFKDLLDNLPPEWNLQLEPFENSMSSALSGLISQISTGGVNFVANMAKGAPGFIISLVFTILGSFFITVNYEKTRNFIMYQLTDRGRELVSATKKAFSGTIFNYLRAYFILMTLTFIELAIGLTVIGIENSVLIAFGIAVFDILPVFGTGGIIIPWIFVDFISGNFPQAIGLLVVYGIVTVVRNFIEPKVVGDQLGLNPVVSIIAIYLGYVWMGVLGMIAMPVTVQILLSLHDKEIITLYKRAPKKAPDDPSVDAENESEASPEKNDKKTRKQKNK